MSIIKFPTKDLDPYSVDQTMSPAKQKERVHEILDRISALTGKPNKDDARELERLRVAKKLEAKQRL